MLLYKECARARAHEMSEDAARTPLTAKQRLLLDRAGKHVDNAKLTIAAEERANAVPGWAPRDPQWDDVQQSMAEFFMVCNTYENERTRYLAARAALDVLAGDRARGGRAQPAAAKCRARPVRPLLPSRDKTLRAELGVRRVLSKLISYNQLVTADSKIGVLQLWLYLITDASRAHAIAQRMPVPRIPQPADLTPYTISSLHDVLFAYDHRKLTAEEIADAYVVANHLLREAGCTVTIESALAWQHYERELDAAAAGVTASAARPTASAVHAWTRATLLLDSTSA